MRKSISGLAAMVALVSAVGGVEAAVINMPAGSTVWMEMRGNVCGAGGDCIGSNQAGPNPTSGIPPSTFGSPPNQLVGSAEVLPDQVRSFLSGRSAGFMFISFEDTYTVQGAASGMFDIPVSLHMTGEMRTVDLGLGTSISHQLVVGNVTAKIGTFNPDPLLPSTLEGVRVQAFSPSTSVTFIAPTIGAGSPQTVPFDITANHTVTGMSVGDAFTLAFGFNSAFALGEIDMSHTGAISFVLPDGVFLTSELGGRFGADVPSEVPLPGALPLFAGGLGLMALLARRRKRAV
jgi:hypothetical protein